MPETIPCPDCFGALGRDCPEHGDAAMAAQNLNRNIKLPLFPPDRVTVLEKNFSAWLRLAPMLELLVVLDVVRQELINARSGPPSAGLTAGTMAAAHVGQAAYLLRLRPEPLDTADGRAVGSSPGEGLAR
jgi:hypothetical protein